MTDVIDFAFYCIRQTWSLIVSQWILSISVLITILGWIVSLIVGSRDD